MKRLILAALVALLAVPCLAEKVKRPPDKYIQQAIDGKYIVQGMTVKEATRAMGASPKPVQDKDGKDLLEWKQKGKGAAAEYVTYWRAELNEDQLLFHVEQEQVRMGRRR